MFQALYFSFFEMLIKLNEKIYFLRKSQIDFNISFDFLYDYY